MKASQSLLAKGFFGRSLDEFKRLSLFGISLFFPLMEEGTY